jgi:hypothetical protein
VKTPRQLLSQVLDAGVRAYNRNPWTSSRLVLVPGDCPPYYAEDELWTRHGHSFVDDFRFRRAYERAVQAGRFDYGIRWRVHTILWAAATAARAEGAFVECGTGRGFMASAICEYLAWDDRPFYLYDTFEPLLDPALPPPATYAQSVNDVRANFAQWAGVRLVVGNLPDTLTDTPEQVAFLHVDLNDAPPERDAVRHFWPRMTPGAILVYDDYGWAGWEASRAAADQLSAELGFSILTLPTGQGLVVKTLDGTSN